MDCDKILIADADKNNAELISIKLSNAGYVLFTATDGEMTLEKVVNNRPDLMLISFDLPGKTSLEVCYELRNNPNFANLPIILMVDRNFDEAQINYSQLKIDDLLVKPFVLKQMLKMVNDNIGKYKLLKHINPDTLLPGKAHLRNDVNGLFQAGEMFDLAFCDLRNLGAYNKKYGFEKGDLVIGFTLELIRRLISSSEVPKAQLYHLGRDDLAILSREEIPHELYQLIINYFHEGVVKLYDEDDVERGGLIYQNRRGMVEQSPIITIDIAVVSNRNRQISGWLEAESIGLELLKYSKTIPGSQWVIDRRKF